MWVRLPYDSEGKGLRIHGVPEAVTSSLWDLADMLNALTNVGFWGQSGQ